MTLKKVTHVIFDMDGLLLDTEHLYEDIMHEMAESYGKKYTSDVRLKILGTVENESARIFVEELQLPVTVEECLKVYYQKIAQVLTNPSFMPGAERLIRHLSKHNVPLAVATSSGQCSYDIKTQNHQEIFKLFHHIVCGTKNPEVKNGKPAPDIFLVCSSKFPDKPKPEQILVFEDSLNGMRAGLSAGMQTVLVPDEGISKKDREGATLVVDSLMNFKPELFGLPPFED